MRLGLRVLRGRGRGVPGPRAGEDRRLEELRRLRSPGRGARGHALELPPLAGLPLRGSGPHGRQRRPAQALLERLRQRPRHRGDPPRRRLPRRPLPDPARRLRPGGRAHRGPRSPRGDPHRQHARRPGGGREGRSHAQEDGAGAGRQRSLPRAGGRRSRARGRELRGVPAHQQRPELHRGQALHRGRAGDGSGSRSSSSRGCGPGRWATRWRAGSTWARRRGATCATSCTSRWRRAWPGRRHGPPRRRRHRKARAPSTRRPSSPA